MAASKIKIFALFFSPNAPSVPRCESETVVHRRHLPNESNVILLANFHFSLELLKRLKFPPKLNRNQTDSEALPSRVFIRRGF